ncbi:MAG: hypothetical protein HQK55_04980 [Deltaproteobacteria bacterium]|nr:hypothetical protein [Deltaproteobacteria bacterium]
MNKPCQESFFAYDRGGIAGCGHVGSPLTIGDTSGMDFKADSQNPSLVSLSQVLEKYDLTFAGTPHRAYRNLSIPWGKMVIDVWNCLKPQVS